MKKELASIKGNSGKQQLRGYSFLVVVACSLFLACQGSEEGSLPQQAEAPEQTPQAATSVPIGTDFSESMGTDFGQPGGTELTSELALDSEALDLKIDKVMEQAKETKEQYAAFRERMFDEALAQMETILCSTYRLQLLGGKEKDFYKKDPDLYIEPLRDVLEKQGRDPFVRLSRERSDVLIDQSSIPEEVLISIPKSEAYSMRSLSLVKLTFRKQMVAITSPDGLTTDLETQESIGRVAWSFDPLGKCEQSFKEPIPYSPTARKESSKNMATLIASSLHGLRAYPAKLETVEREWTRANDLKPVLVKLKESIAFNKIDPTAKIDPDTQRNVINYERELTEAVAELSRARAEGRMEATVDPKEVQEILRIFK